MFEIFDFVFEKLCDFFFFEHLLCEMVESLDIMKFWKIFISMYISKLLVGFYLTQGVSPHWGVFVL